MLSLLAQQFSCYSLMKFVMTLSAILLSMVMILLSNLSVIKHLIYNMLWTGRGSGLPIPMLEKLILHCLTSLITLVLLMWKWMGLFLRGNDLFSSCWLPFSSKLELNSYIVSSAKTVSKKIEAIVHSMNFFSPEVALYLYKSTIRPGLEYCCHIWADAPRCYLEFLDKLQKWLCKAVGISLVARNLASLIHFFRCYFDRCWSALAPLVPLPYSQGGSIHYSNRLHDFSVTIPRCYKGAYVNSFFPHTPRLWNSLPIKCFPLTYYLNGFNLELTDTF